MNGEASFSEEIVKPKKSRSSPSNIRRNRERAATFREKKRQGTQVSGCCQFGSMNSSAELLQINTKSENADENSSVNHDDSDTFSSNHESFKETSLEEKPVEAEKQKPGDIENVVFPPLLREIDKIVYWSTNLEEKAAKWKQMVLEDPSIDLFTIQWNFFKKAKVDMSDNALFESWFRTAHSNYGNLISNISLLSLNCD